MSISLSMAVSFSQDSVPANSPVRLLYVLLEIQVQPVGAPDPLPVNIAMVVDKSDSMCIPILTQEQFVELARLGMASETMVDGVPVWHFENVPASHKIQAPRSVDFVKRALHSALERLSARDHFSLVAFARDARVLIPQQSGQNKRALLEVIGSLDGLELGNETYMAAGMNLGYDQVRNGLSRERVNRMVVLTDGFTLDGAQCQFLAQRAAREGISISTLGLGVEFNEELLISIADSSGGNAYFIHDPVQIPDAFAQELSGIQNVVLRELTLKVRFMQGVELRRVHRVQPIISDLGAPPLVEQSFDLALGDLGQRGEIALLFEVTVPTRPEGAYQLAHGLVEYDEPRLGEFGKKIRQDLVIDYAASAIHTRVHPRVMNIVEKVSAFKLQTRALADAARGDVAGATLKLKAAATRLINMGEQDLAQAALNEAANLEQRGHMSAAGTKQLRYDTRRLTQKVD